MIWSAYVGFSHLVVAGERIENDLKSGKIQGPGVASNGAKKPYNGFPITTSTSKGNGKAYQIPYYQIAEVTPNKFQ